MTRTVRLTLFFLLSAFFANHPAFAVQESEPLEKPKLVAIASLLPDDAKDLSELQCHAPDGGPVDQEILKRLKRRLEPKHFQYEEHVTERHDHLKPKFFVFNVDTRLAKSGVIPYLEINGKEVAARSFHFGPNGGFLTSIVTGKKEMESWPDTCELSFRYADKLPEVVKTVYGPIAGKVDLTNEIYCQLSDRMGSPALHTYRPFSHTTKTTEIYTVETKLIDDTDLNRHSIHVEISNEDPRKRYVVEVSEPVIGRDIKEITVTASTFAYHQFGTVHLRPKPR